MTRRLVWSSAALTDFQEAVAWLAERNPPAARRVADAIVATAEGLADRPIGRPGRVSGTYEKVVPRLPYIVAYGLDPDEDGKPGLVILRVIHGARDWPQDRWPC